MIKTWIIMMSSLLVIVLIFPEYGSCEEMTNADIIKELKAMKARINRLETELSKKDKVVEELKKEAVKKKEMAEVTKGKKKKWTDKIAFSGAIEFEFSNEHHDIRNPANNYQGDTTQSHDITLATVELGIDAQINKYTQGHVLLLYEEDDTDPINIDEANIIIGGIEETYGLFLKGGRYYPHFGELNSYFVSDPLTLEVFEINESSVEAGYENKWVSAKIGVFHCNIQEAFNTESRINGFFADASFYNSDDTLGGLSYLIGASYLSNVADSDTLQGEVQDINGDGNRNDLNDYVGGLAAYLVAEYMQFSFGAEYITGLDDFFAGEMGYAIDRNGVARSTKPAAWNFEFAFRPIETVQLAVKYEGTDEMFGLYPEHQYGGVVSWELFQYATFSAECLHGEYDENNRNANGMVEDERNLLTLQLAVEF